MLARNQIRRDSGRMRTPQPIFENVVFLCSWDGSDAATSADDDSDIGATITFADQAQLDTAKRRLGPSSLLLDGGQDDCRVSYNAEYQIGIQDFTLETYVNFNATDEQALMFVYFAGSNQRAYGIQYYPTGIIVPNELFFYWSPNGTSSNNFTRPWRGEKPILTDQWYHVASCRRAGLFRMFLDGKQLGKTEIFTDSIFESTSEGIYFGEIKSNIVNLDGHLDETRITIGEGIYTKDFVPPQSKLPRQ